MTKPLISVVVNWVKDYRYLVLLLFWSLFISIIQYWSTIPKDCVIKSSDGQVISNSGFTCEIVKKSD